MTKDELQQHGPRFERASRIKREIDNQTRLIVARSGDFTNIFEEAQFTKSEENKIEVCLKEILNDRIENLEKEFAAI